MTLKIPRTAVQGLREAMATKSNPALSLHIRDVLRYVDDLEAQNRMKPKTMEPPPGLEERFQIRAPIGLSWESYQRVLDVTKQFIHEHWDDKTVDRWKPLVYAISDESPPLYVKCYWGARSTARIAVSRRKDIGRGRLQDV